jgi:hypothetical protein
MVKRKRTKGETTQWSKEKGQKERQHKGLVLSLLLSFFFCSLCCLSFCPFYFAHCVVSPFVLFILPIVLKERQHNGQKKRTKGETTQWSKEKGQKERQHKSFFF